MSEYRTTATLTAEGTFVVPGPEGLPEGTPAEVTILISDAPATFGDLADYFRWLESQPPRKSAAEEEQAFLRKLRDEWD